MRSLLAMFPALLSIAPAFALDPELKTPYQLKVVMRVGEHPHFTPHFRAELKRDLLGSLQAALGNLGTVEIVDLHTLPADKWEPMWKAVDEKGFAALDGLNEIGGGKTHFLKIVFAEGHYDLQARQHDGTTGFATPITRKSRTSDRAFVARLAGLMIGQDFGIVGTFDTVVGDKALVRFKAGDLAPLTKWVKKDDVFAIIYIRSPKPRPYSKDPAAPKGPPPSTGVRAEGVIMQVLSEPKDGVCQCRMFSRIEDPLFIKDKRNSQKLSSLQGYRIIKLGTTEAPLKLQLVDANGQPHRGALQVIARGEDFPDTITEREQTVNRDGIFVSKGNFTNVAFVRVILGNVRLARIPIEMLDDRVEVRTIRLEPGAELKDRLELLKRDVAGRIHDGRLIQIRCFQDITALEQGGKNQAALERGQTTLKAVEAMAGELQEDIERLQVRIKELPAGALSLADCEQQLQEMKGNQNKLKEHLGLLEIAIREENDPSIQARKKKVQEITRRAELLGNQAEFDKALAAYEEALAEVKDEPAARAAIEKPYEALKKAWTLTDGDAQHAEARKWIYGTWPTLANYRDLRAQLPTARLHFEKCKSVGDRLTVKKMELAGQEVLNQFATEVDTALKNESTEEEDKKILEAMIKVKNDFEKLLTDVDAFLAEKPKAKK